jgi:hypothetical protein
MRMLHAIRLVRLTVTKFSHHGIHAPADSAPVPSRIALFNVNLSAANRAVQQLPATSRSRLAAATSRARLAAATKRATLRAATSRARLAAATSRVTLPAASKHAIFPDVLP